MLGQHSDGIHASESELGNYALPGPRRNQGGTNPRVHPAKPRLDCHTALPINSWEFFLIGRVRVLGVKPGQGDKPPRFSLNYVGEGEGRIGATRAESQWIVAARPLCHLQYPVAYLSRLQRILLAARWELRFRASRSAHPPRGVRPRHVPSGSKPYCWSAIGRRAHASLWPGF